MFVATSLFVDPQSRDERLEQVLAEVGSLLTAHSYPVTSASLAQAHADYELTAPGTPETLGDLFERVPEERFETPEAALSAAFVALTGARPDDETASRLLGEG